MNNNFYEIPHDWYSNFIPENGIPNSFNFKMNNDLVDPKIALDRGNLFNNLYDPYRNYKYRELRPSNRREELFYNILMHNFALVELDLYLDLNPQDSNIIGLYNKYLGNKKMLVDEYEKNFGPLTLDSLNNGNVWTWNKEPWPWEVTK